MKRITTILMATLVVLSSFAFTKAAKQSRLDIKTWHLKANQDPSLPSSYEEETSSFDCGASGSNTCVIRDVESASVSGEPALSYGTPSASNGANYDRETRVNP